MSWIGGRASQTLASAIVLGLSVAPATDARGDFIDHFATGADVGKMKVPREGDVPILVIPLIVDDQAIDPGFEAAVRAYFAPNAGPPSFSAYFRTTSGGRYRPAPVVAPAVHLPTCPPLGSYTGCAIPRGGGLDQGDLVGAVRLLRDALRLIDEVVECAQQGPGNGRSCTSGGSVDLATIDRSGPAGAADGWADGILIVSNAAFPGITLPVKWLSERPTLRLTTPPLPDFVYGGVSVGAVGIASDETGTLASSIATHEFGHLLGFADLYNEQGTTIDMPYSSMGGWPYRTPPPLLDPYSRAAIGWANVRQISGSATVELYPAALGAPVLKLGTGPELFFVEYRTRTAWVDGDLGVEGAVVVQRVRTTKLPSPDEGRFLGTLAKCVNCERWNPLTLMEQADQHHDLQLKTAGQEDGEDLFTVGDVIAPSSDTAPRNDQHLVFSTNRLTGEATGVRIEVLSISADRAVVAVEAPGLGDTCSDMAPYCGGQACNAGYCGAAFAPPLPEDAGVADVGSSADAAASADAATHADASSGTDAASTDTAAADAQEPNVDAGAVAPPDDAGTVGPGPDAGPSVSAADSGEPHLPEASGCGCRAAGTERRTSELVATFGLLLLAAFRARSAAPSPQKLPRGQERHHRQSQG